VIVEITLQKRSCSNPRWCDWAIIKANTLRLQVEKKWIHRLRCPAPYGINLMNNLVDY
jgi:hypothetical protein